MTSPLATMPTRSGYGERVVALIDVLGASRALLSPESSRRFTEILAVIISRIVREKEEPWLLLPHVLTGEEVEIENPRPVSKGTRVTAVSDSIVISLPFGSRRASSERLAQIFSCIHSVAVLQRSLLTLGLRSRGGITIGGLVHTRDVVVGESLVRVHHLESKIAKVPRAIVDERLVNLLIEGASGPQPSLALFTNRVAHALRQDSDGYFFVDYLAADPISGSFNLTVHLRDIWMGLKAEFDTESDAEIKNKIVWLDSYIKRSLETKAEPFPRQSHATKVFSDIYPRTADNVKSWTDDLILARTAAAIA